MITTRKRKVTEEVIGEDIGRRGVLSGIEEMEEISADGMTTTNKVVRNFYACGHRHTGKDAGAAAVKCSVCGRLWCPECAKTAGYFCEGCRRWVCEADISITLIGGYALCGTCGPLVAMKRGRNEEGGLLGWLRW
jgi:hypothetical protein